MDLCFDNHPGASSLIFQDSNNVKRPAQKRRSLVQQQTRQGVVTGLFDALPSHMRPMMHGKEIVGGKVEVYKSALFYIMSLEGRLGLRREDEAPGFCPTRNLQLPWADMPFRERKRLKLAKSREEERDWQEKLRSALPLDLQPELDSSGTRVRKGLPELQRKVLQYIRRLEEACGSRSASPELLTNINEDFIAQCEMEWKAVSSDG